MEHHDGSASTLHGAHPRRSKRGNRRRSLHSHTPDARASVTRCTPLAVQRMYDQLAAASLATAVQHHHSSQGDDVGAVFDDTLASPATHKAAIVLGAPTQQGEAAAAQPQAHSRRQRRVRRPSQRRRVVVGRAGGADESSKRLSHTRRLSTSSDVSSGVTAAGMGKRRVIGVGRQRQGVRNRPTSAPIRRHSAQQ